MLNSPFLGYFYFIIKVTQKGGVKMKEGKIENGFVDPGEKEKKIKKDVNRKIELEMLLKEITPENKQEEINFGIEGRELI
jgi:hypothetical protein